MNLNTKKWGKRAISPLKFRRSIFHIIFGTAILYSSVKYYYEGIRWILFAILVMGMLISIISLRFKIPFIHYMLKKFEKPQYIRKFPGKGALFFLAGCLLVLKIFPKTMAFAAIAILTFADPLASISGLIFGTKSHKKPFNTLKKIEGTLVGVVVGFFVALMFVSFTEALAASIGAMLAEALTIRLGGDDVDDNLVVPVAAATSMYIKVLLLPFI
jgi:dolichol kinase